VPCLKIVVVVVVVVFTRPVDGRNVAQYVTPWFRVVYTLHYFDVLDRAAQYIYPLSNRAHL